MVFTTFIEPIAARDIGINLELWIQPKFIERGKVEQKKVIKLQTK